MTFRSRARSLAAVAAATALAGGVLALPSGTAGAGTLLTWTGTVSFTADGDTAHIDIAGDSTGARAVRNNGIQAMETGQCKAASAKYALHKLIPDGSKVTMKASKADAWSGGRPLRLVYNSAGVDVQKALLDQGWVLPFSMPQDPLNQPAYYAAAQKAAQSGLGLYNQSNPCKTGPYQTARLKVWVSYDADGDDLANLNGEYIRVLNQGGGALDMSGWWLRTAAPEIYRFPSGTWIPAGGTLTLHVGKGTRTKYDLYMGMSAPHFPNPGMSTLIGSGGFLFDPDGDLRAWSTYPCLYGCADALDGKVALRADYNPPGDEELNWNLETLRVTNTSQARVDVSYRVLQYKSWTWEIRPGTYLDPGESLYLHVGKGTQTRQHQYWGKTRDMLNNYDGVALLRTTSATTIACDAWGSGTC